MQLMTQTPSVIETSRACSRFSRPSAFVDGSISPTLCCKFAEIGVANSQKTGLLIRKETVACISTAQ